MRRIFLFTLFFVSSAYAQTAVTSVYPASGLTSGGTFVHILGTDLLGFPLACPALECGNYVRFGDVLGTISINSSTEIVAQTPPHAAGPVDVTVNIAGKAKITIPAAFRYESPALTDNERILVPLFLGRVVPGAYGSMWLAELTLHNASDADIPVAAPNCDPVHAAPCPPPLHLPPYSTVLPNLYTQPGGGPGIFIYVPRTHIRDVDISIRVQDISRQAQTWGTQIPVVRSTDFQGIMRLNAVPTDARFRTTLRVYGYGGASDPVALRIFDPASALPLVDSRLDLRGTQDSQTYPAYLQIDGLAEAFPAIRGHAVVRVEAASDFIPPKPLWAFISVTNNETQHVTLITPSPTASP